MDVGASFVADTEATELVQPRQGTLNDPAIDTEAAPVFGPALGQDGFNPTLLQRNAVWLGMVGAITLHTIGPATRSSRLAGDRRDRIDQRQHLRYIVPIRAAKLRGERNTIRIGDDVVLRAVFSTIRGIWPCLRPPKTARIDALSTTARDQSILSASRKRLSNRW
jgi:hypothetical protein